MKTKPPRPANAGPPRSGRRVGRGAIPRPVKVDTPFPHAGPAPRVAAPSGSLREGDTSLGQVQANSKRSPLKINPQAERGVWCFGGGFLVAWRRFPSGLEIAHQMPLPRARWGLPRELSPIYPCLCVPHRARRRWFVPCLSQRRLLGLPTPRPICLCLTSPKCSPCLCHRARVAI